MKSLKGKVMVVVDGTSDVGVQMVRALAAEGAAVVVGYAECRVSAETLVDEIIHAGGQAVALRADARQRDDMTTLFSVVREIFGRLDVLVQRAGRSGQRMLVRMSPDARRQHVNALLGVIREALVRTSGLLTVVPTPGAAAAAWVPDHATQPLPAGVLARAVLPAPQALQ
ncbi:short-chain dehydrogenase [Isoalcanivorax pacificus W11-5]|uniref:Short-chain dehydrogenase n=1 Tax=Isoalcanivorax pacificus W11-5 TaxID=391936 RepID=A0A0B4XJC6_9GAMM|nr:SDR family NAD(P)-dependent oxidoreductase [Isoalcanivorax pacificus]AJD46795.1 short-chain dehydrogenase [Isoalcanivorax pacificus W11-5]